MIASFFFTENKKKKKKLKCCLNIFLNKTKKNKYNLYHFLTYYILYINKKKTENNLLDY